MTRAVLLWRQRRDSEALRWAKAAAARFLSREDMERYCDAKECEALALQRLGQHLEAMSVFDDVYRRSDGVRDPEKRARAASNLAICYREAGNLDDASRLFSETLQYYEGLGMPAMVVRTHWSIARLSLSAGRAAEAALRLPSIITDLESHGLASDAAYARLDLTTAWVMIGRYDAVITECTKLVAHFSQAQILTGALTAIAYMREAAHNGTLREEEVQAVARYVKALATTPDLPFLPPASPGRP